MKSSRTYIIVLVSVLLATSTCLADDDIDSAVNPVAGAGKSDPEIQSIAADYFDSNWALFSDGNQAPAPIDPLAGISANYFDANWALFSDGNQAPAPIDPLAEISADYFDANWALFSNDSQPYSATQAILADRTQSSDLGK